MSKLLAGKNAIISEEDIAAYRTEQPGITGTMVNATCGLVLR
jgi:hypothetical protein